MVLALARSLLLFCVSLSALGQAILAGETRQVDLWPHVLVLSDPAGTLTPDQAAAMRGRFAAPTGAYATLGMKKEVVWLRAPVTTGERGGGLWILDIDYALLRRIDAFEVVDGKARPLATFGNDTPFAERPLPGRTH